jgi:hypothetical protein
MDLFIEKEFAENFQIEYYPGKETEIQKIVFSIFSEYTGINWFLNASEDFVKENELLFKLSDYNLNYKLDVDFDKLFDKKFIPRKQTIVLTEKPRTWFSILKEKGVLCFSYDTYERELKYFLETTRLIVELDNPENIPIDWNIFRFLKKERNFIIISDPYILSDSIGQEISKNLIPLLKNNLNKEHSYSIFIITEVDSNVEKKLLLLYSALKAYQIKLYVFNRIRKIEDMKLHGRILYSNYTFTKSGIGFNLNIKKMVNEEVSVDTFFNKSIYRRMNEHFKQLVGYIKRLEKLEHDKFHPYTTNTPKSYEVFREILS